MLNAVKMGSGKKLSGSAREAIRIDPELLVQLYELLQGERGVVRVYSHALESEICFVNPAVVSPSAAACDCPVYTTRELALVLGFTREELKQFHTLKKRLSG